MVQKAFGVLFLFGVAPVCTGLLWVGQPGKKRRGPDFVYLAGFLTQLALFQLVAVPVMIAKPHGMGLLTGLAAGLGAALSIAGVALRFPVLQDFAHTGAARISESLRKAGDGNGRRRRGRKRRGKAAGQKGKPPVTERGVLWALALAVVGFQMYMAFAYASFDGDDSYYVVQSVLADQTGVLNRIRPYTGLSTDLDIRHALATLPLWVAYVARVTGIHATIVAHTLSPLVWIPLTYLCYFEIGRLLFGAENVRLPVFMALTGILQIFGNTSIYTNATFFLTRTWQGKSVLCNFVLLVQIWLLLEIFGRKKDRYQKVYWKLLAVNNVVSAMMTSMGAFLAAMFLGIAGLSAAVRQRRPVYLLRAAVCCVPNVLYLVMLLVMG